MDVQLSAIGKCLKRCSQTRPRHLDRGKTGVLASILDRLDLL
jgi:hypothetical protein